MQAEHRGTRAVQRLVEHAPSTGGLALWVRHADRAAADDTPGLPPMTTDGRTLFYGEAFSSLSPAQQAGWVAHGVLHVALQHAQRLQTLQRSAADGADAASTDSRLFNLCADAVVNSSLAHLGWLQLAPGAVELPTLLHEALGLQQGTDEALAAWDVESLYRAVQQAQRRDGRRAAAVQQLARHSAPDLQPASGQQAQAPEDVAGEEREWQSRLLRAHAGDGAHSMLRALLADLPGPRTPWEQVLRAQLARSLSQRMALAWSRPARSYLANQGRTANGRRMPWEPGRMPGQNVPRLVVVVDVSGSVDTELLQRFATEIDAIARRQQAALTLVVGDDRVRRVQTVDAPGRGSARAARPLDGLQCHGGGGTDFTPLLEEAHRHQPDITVVLTDLDGPARWRPPWPVLWAVPQAHAGAQAPFGRKLVLR